MSHLKEQNLKKCFSILEEFIENPNGTTGKQNAAFLALNHLQSITAGVNTPAVPKYEVIPMADPNPTGSYVPKCDKTPMADPGSN